MRGHAEDMWRGLRKKWRQPAVGQLFSTTALNGTAQALNCVRLEPCFVTIELAHVEFLDMECVRNLRRCAMLPQSWMNEFFTLSKVGALMLPRSDFETRYLPRLGSRLSTDDGLCRNCELWICKTPKILATRPEIWAFPQYVWISPRVAHYLYSSHFNPLHHLPYCCAHRPSLCGLIFQLDECQSFHIRIVLLLTTGPLFHPCISYKLSITCID